MKTFSIFPLFTNLLPLSRNCYPLNITNFFLMNLRKILLLTILQIITVLISLDISAQNPAALFGLSIKERSNGNFEEAEQYLYELLKLNDTLSIKYRIAVNNQLGLINKDLGKYNDALNYFKKAENICINEIGEDYSILSLIYNNMAIIYKLNYDYEKALEYYNIALNSLNDSNLPFKEKMYETSKIHHNIGIVYKHLNEIEKAIENFEKSRIIIKRYSLEGIERVYVNLARTYEKSGEHNLAEKYYQKSIFERNRKKENLHKNAGVYNDYSYLLLKMGQKEKANNYLMISHEIYVTSYGQRHPFTASSYLTMGDFYHKNNDLRKSLKFYQKSIISNTKQFNNTDIFSLPPLDDIIADMQFLKSLKRKSEALFIYSEQLKTNNQKIKTLNACINSVELSLIHISNVRKGYLTQSSKLNITEDEKACYFQAIEASIKLFEITNNEKFKNQAYSYSQKSKASLLREEILQNKAFTAILPDSVRKNKMDIESNIHSYKKLIFDENERKDPNQDKINKWSHSLFILNNEYEDLIAELKIKYPGYEQLTSKTQIVSLEDLQKRLNKDETLIEYSLSQPNEEKNRELFVFVITKDSLNYYQKELSNKFEEKISYVRSQMNEFEGHSSDITKYNQLNKTLFELYSLLIKPGEKWFKGSKLFIIPDEEIAYLSFDALQKEFTAQTSINYASLPYLIYDYCFSYAYASSLLFQDVPPKYKNEFVYAFAPNYTGQKLSETRLQFGKLENTEKEINSILTWFNGKALVGREANEEFFKTISNQSGIFHFAMHASAEKSNPDFSFLAITQEDDTEEDGMFYNYEIAMMNMKATMVVLSGCNTGDGVISSGEGVMSLTRNFILAGAPSIVHSLWEVQDETSVVIMNKFYEYLSKGMSKNEALRQAKLNYIKNVTPAMVNPYFWSGYVHSGNPCPVANNNALFYSLLSVFLLISSTFIFWRIKKSKK